MGKRKLVAALFAIVVLSQTLTSCSTNDKKVEIEKPAKDIQKEVPKSWETDMSEYTVHVDYSLPDFKPDAEEYSVKKDLSDLFNAGQFDGFTEKQKTSISEDGFVVLEPSYEFAKLHHVYESSLYKNIPTFITVDSALHMYHLYYDSSLKMVEASSLSDKLISLSKNMLHESLEAYLNEEYSVLKEELKFVSSYFLTGAMLLDADIQDADVPEEIKALSEEEISLIQSSEGFSKSPTLKKDMDYSQFTVRGHYAGNEVLERYFRAMMWYGLAGFPVFDETKEEPVLDIDSMVKSMIITCLTLKSEESFKDYENIYSTTALYVGLSDDIGIFRLRELVTNVYGKDPDLRLFKDESYHDELLKEALLLPEPEIKPKYSSVNTAAGRQFRFMGQRYSFDAETLQNLMEPILRPVPSGLDVAAALGSERAEELLDKYYKPKEMWGGYETNLNLMKEKQAGFTDEQWSKDLYKGWLWCIKSSASRFADMEGMPGFMRSEKWTDKNIHTALGSYAELKHDSILYMKQAVAEMGGGPEFIPYNYVEPNVEVYAKLKWLAQYTKEHLNIRGMLNEPSSNVLDSMIEAYDTLMTVSVKELTNEAVTEEENYRLYTYGGRIDSLVQIINSMMWEENIDTGNEYTTALIADIATVAPSEAYPYSSYLEIGNGLPLEIYVACRTNGKTYLAKGALFNYYEFLTNERLTDSKWHSMIGVEKHAMVYNPKTGSYEESEVTDENNIQSVPDNKDYFEIMEMKEPVEMVSKPEWTYSFISGEGNHVTIQGDINPDWSK